MKLFPVIAVLAVTAVAAHSQQPSRSDTVQPSELAQKTIGTGNAMDVQDTGNTLVIAPSSALFGNVIVGTASPALSITATNHTAGNVSLRSSSGFASFKGNSGTCHLMSGGAILAPGASCAFTLEFAPIAIGPVIGTVTLSTDLGPVVFQASGTGVAPAPVSYTETVLYSFCSAAYCADGSTPFAGLVQDAAGNLYGTTLYGGTPSYCGDGCGTVFKVDSTGHETVVHSFCSAPAILGQDQCPDGLQPNAGLILDASGNLYGTTTGGGAGTNLSPSAGVVFKIDETGSETVLYTFCSVDNCADGNAPRAGLVRDAAGSLYGTADLGGIGASPCDKTTGYDCSGGGGLVFKVDTMGHETVLHNFCAGYGCTDGSNPYFSGLTRDASGTLYGTTYLGGAGSSCIAGSGCGTVFKVDTADHETVLHSFCSVGYYCDDGLYPQAGLTQDAAGNLYGTTGYGGGPAGAGTVFKIDNSGNETVLYDFCSAAQCADGLRPLAGLIQDAAGNLYGTTFYGGVASSSCPYGSNNCGTVFKLDSAGNETVLYSFCSAANCADGESPQAALIQDAYGNLYGTTRAGGAYGKGTVFKLTPQFK